VNSICYSCPDLYNARIFEPHRHSGAWRCPFSIYTLPQSRISFFFFLCGQYHHSIFVFFFFKNITSNRIEMKNEGGKNRNKRRMEKEIGVVKAKEFGKIPIHIVPDCCWYIVLIRLFDGWFPFLSPPFFFLLLLLLLLLLFIYSFTTATAFWSLIATCDAVMTPATGVVEILISAPRSFSLYSYRHLLSCENEMFWWGKIGRRSTPISP